MNVINVYDISFSFFIKLDIRDPGGCYSSYLCKVESEKLFLRLLLIFIQVHYNICKITGKSLTVFIETTAN